MFQDYRGHIFFLIPPFHSLFLCPFLLEENSQNIQPSSLLSLPSLPPSSSSSSSSLVTSIQPSQPLLSFKSSPSFTGLTLSSTFLSHLGLLLLFFFQSLALSWFVLLMLHTFSFKKTPNNSPSPEAQQALVINQGSPTSQSYKEMDLFWQTTS